MATGSRRRSVVTLDVSKLNEEQRTRLTKQIETAGGKTLLTVDAAAMTPAQRDKLTTKLRDMARGVAPSRAGSLVGAEDNHVSHRDTDGWF